MSQAMAARKSGPSTPFSLLAFALADEGAS